MSGIRIFILTIFQELAPKRLNQISGRKIIMYLHPLSFSKALKSTIADYKSNVWLFLRLSLITTLILLIQKISYDFAYSSQRLILENGLAQLTFLGYRMTLTHFQDVFITNVGWSLFFLSFYYFAGLNYLYLKLSQHKQVFIKDLFLNAWLAIKYIICSCLCWIPLWLVYGNRALPIDILVLGSIFGLLVYTTYYFAGYFVLDKHLSIRKSLTASNILSFGNKQRLLLFELCIGVVIFCSITLFKMSLFQKYLHLSMLMEEIIIAIILSIFEQFIALVRIYFYRQLSDDLPTQNAFVEEPQN